MKYKGSVKMTPKELLKNLGYDDDGIVKILEWYNNRLPETLNYYIEKTFNYFIKKGYTKDEIKKMTKTIPTMFSYSEENLGLNKETGENLIL